MYENEVRTTKKCTILLNLCKYFSKPRMKEFQLFEENYCCTFEVTSENFLNTPEQGTAGGT